MDGEAITAAFRVSSNTLLICLYVMMGEVRLVGERTPNLPESGSDGSSGLWRIGGEQVGGSTPEDRLLVKMADARGVSGRRNGKLPPWPEQATSRWAACWQGWLKLVVCLDAGEAGFRRGRKVIEVGNEPVDRLWAVRRQGCWRPEICSGFAVMASPKVARPGSEIVGSLSTVCCRGWQRPAVCRGFRWLGEVPSLPEATGTSSEPAGRLFARIAKARDVSGASGMAGSVGMAGSDRSGSEARRRSGCGATSVRGSCDLPHQTFGHDCRRAQSASP